MRDQPWFLGRGPVLTIMLAIALFAAGMAHKGAIVPRILLEFVFGTWPNQTYGDYTPAWMSSSGLLALGVLLQTLAVLAIPVLLGLWVSYVTQRTERRLRMDMQTYFTQRDTFFAMEVLRAVAGPLRNAGVPDEESRRLVLTAFERANDELRRIQSQSITDALNDVNLTTDAR